MGIFTYSAPFIQLEWNPNNPKCTLLTHYEHILNARCKLPISSLWSHILSFHPTSSICYYKHLYVLLCDMFAILNSCCLYCILYIHYYSLLFLSLLWVVHSFPWPQSICRTSLPTCWDECEICVLIHFSVNQEMPCLIGPALYIPPFKLKQEVLHCTGPHRRKWGTGDGKKQIEYKEGKYIFIEETFTLSRQACSFNKLLFFF